MSNVTIDASGVATETQSLWSAQVWGRGGEGHFDVLNIPEDHTTAAEKAAVRLVAGGGFVRALDNGDYLCNVKMYGALARCITNQ
jgi:hypothetical protein